MASKGRSTISPAALGYDICPSTGKARFESESRALAEMEELRRRREPGQKRHRRAYRCAACNGWHLTSRKGHKR